MRRKAAPALLFAAALAAFAAVNAAYERRILAPMLGPDLAAALGVAALAGAVVAGALLLVGMRRA